MRKYEVTKIVNPCERCAGIGYSKSSDGANYEWLNFQKNVADFFAENPNPSAAEITDIKNLMPQKPSLIKCPQCSGNGKYEGREDLKKVMIEILAERNFNQLVESEREYQANQKLQFDDADDIPY